MSLLEHQLDNLYLRLLKMEQETEKNLNAKYEVEKENILLKKEIEELKLELEKLNK